MKRIHLFSLSLALVLAIGCGNGQKAEEKKASIEAELSEKSVPAETVTEINSTTTKESNVSNPTYRMTTTLGEMIIELDSEKAPLSAANFDSYVQKGHYDGTIFHRVISNFMIQGGGFDSDMNQKPTDAQIENEAANGLKNLRGTLAMARTGAVHSATSQFFINVVDNAFLDYRGPDPRTFGYCVFGKVIEGMDVVDKIRNVKTGTKARFQDVPEETVKIIKVEALQD